MPNPSYSDYKDIPVDKIMNVGEVRLIKPVSAKRSSKEEFEFTFATSTFTDPSWRELFNLEYKKQKAAFHGSEFTLTCKRSDLDHELPAIKLAIMAANDNYKEKRKVLIAQVEAGKEEAKKLAFDRNLEEGEVHEMFLKMKL